MKITKENIVLDTRRIFSIDIGDLTISKVKEYLPEIINKFKLNTIKDDATGSIKEEV